MKTGKNSPTYCSKKIHTVKIELPSMLIHDGCCKVVPMKLTEADVLEDKTFDILNSDQAINDREVMLSGGENESCKYCWDMEALTGTSRRTSVDKYPSDKELTSDKGELHRTELVLSNVCTLNCMYCSPRNSSKIYDDVAKNGKYRHLREMHDMPYKPVIAKNMMALETSIVDDVLNVMDEHKTITLSGGEPTLSKNFWRVMEHCLDIDGTDRNISINTNAMLPDDKVDNLISIINKLTDNNWSITITLSVDTNKEQAEYIRYGLDYDRLLYFYERLSNETSAILEVSITTTGLIIENCHFMVKDIVSRSKVFDRKILHFNDLVYPDFLSMQRMPLSMRLDFVERMDAVLHDVIPTGMVDVAAPNWNMTKRTIVLPNVYDKTYPDQLEEYFVERDNRLGSNRSVFNSLLEDMRRY